MYFFYVPEDVIKATPVVRICYHGIVNRNCFASTYYFPLKSGILAAKCRVLVVEFLVGRLDGTYVGSRSSHH